jgi:Holliday junction DNA helicase RuvA
MIGRLVGHVVGQDDDGTCTLDVHGVGYEVTVPLGTLGRAVHVGGDEGPLVLHVHTVVREDAFLLYGFASLEDRAAFRVLLSVSSIGPKTAVGILSALPAAELRDAVARKELARLTSISGVGRKTAERILLELPDKIGALPTSAPSTPAAARAPAGAAAKAKLLEGALANMGFRPAEVERAVEAVRDRIPAAELSDLVREALAFAGR